MEMIKFDKALEIVIDTAFSTGTERIPFTESLDRVLAEPVTSDVDMPPFNKASVDGFAARRSDLHNELEIVETIPAGKVPEKSVGMNQCARIMTGAPVPEGADCVIMVEDTVVLPSGKLEFRGNNTKVNIAFKAEDIRNGDVVLEPGRIIRPQDIAVMAATGNTIISVSRMPRVGIISSGSELVEPDKKPGMSQIRNSNSFQLMAQSEKAGARARYYGIARDDEDATFKIVTEALAENDIILISGGVSMGDFDFVPTVLERAGIKILFSRVAVQPGKPTTFGIHKSSVAFGLPGNPVSAFMIFELLVRPLINKMMGHNYKVHELFLPMKDNYTRKAADRMAVIPVNLSDKGMVIPVEFHGSAHISAIPHSFGIIMLPAGSLTIGKGEIVRVRPI
jgi:molybdopterin molybdotransferase